jgi:hypothetical protein
MSAPLLALILSVAQQLSDECRSIRFTRSALSRHTRIQRCLARASTPLQSLIARVRRGLVPESECAYTAFARATLLRFQSDLLSLFRAMDNRARRVVAPLVERTAHTVALVEDRERAMILRALVDASL